MTSKINWRFLLLGLPLGVFSALSHVPYPHVQDCLTISQPSPVQKQENDVSLIISKLKACGENKKCFFESSYEDERLFFKARVVKTHSEMGKAENELAVLRKKIVGLVELRQCFRSNAWVVLGFERLKTDLNGAKNELIKSQPSVKTSIFKQVITIVMRLHKEGIFHKDLSLKNVMLTHSPEPEVKLIDFETSGPRRQHNRRMTPASTAPEFYRWGWGIPFEERSEVWSLGIIYLYLNNPMFVDYLLNEYQLIIKAEFDWPATQEFRRKLKEILSDRSIAVETAVERWLEPAIHLRSTLTSMWADIQFLGDELFTYIARKPLLSAPRERSQSPGESIQRPMKRKSKTIVVNH